MSEASSPESAPQPVKKPNALLKGILTTIGLAGVLGGAGDNHPVNATPLTENPNSKPPLVQTITKATPTRTIISETDPYPETGISPTQIPTETSTNK